jgi:hypothetical protein
VKELLDDMKELLDDVKKSSHAINQLAPVLPILRPDRFGFRAVLEESLHVAFVSKSVGSESRDDVEESRA